MTLLFRSFVSATGVLATVTVNAASVLFFDPQMIPPFISAIFLPFTVMSVLAAGLIVLLGWFGQERKNRYEAAYRETCISMCREPESRRSPDFLEAVDERERLLAQADRRTPWEQKRSFAMDIARCLLLGIMVDLLIGRLLPEGCAGLRCQAFLAIRILPGLLAVAAYCSYTLYLVTRMKEAGLMLTIVEAQIEKYDMDEVIRRKDMWVIRYLKRTLLEIIYEPRS